MNDQLMIDPLVPCWFWLLFGAHGGDQDGDTVTWQAKLGAFFLCQAAAIAGDPHPHLQGQGQGPRVISLVVHHQSIGLFIKID